MIEAINLRMLRNGEFVQFTTNFSDIVEGNDPILLNVVPQQAFFKLKVLETSELFKLDRANKITGYLVQMDVARDRAINGLASVIEGYCSHFNPDFATAAGLLSRSLEVYGVRIAKQNYQAETATINGIINDWETKPELADALETLNLIAWKDELKMNNQIFNDTYLNRAREYGAEGSDTMDEKREETLEAYSELRKYLDAYLVIQNSALYHKTINELNAVIELYNVLLNGRLKEPVVVPVPADK